MSGYAVWGSKLCNFSKTLFDQKSSVHTVFSKFFGEIYFQSTFFLLLFLDGSADAFPPHHVKLQQHAASQDDMRQPKMPWCRTRWRLTRTCHQYDQSHHGDPPWYTESTKSQQARYTTTWGTHQSTKTLSRDLRQQAHSLESTAQPQPRKATPPQPPG